jgi:hypothetical protein
MFKIHDNLIDDLLFEQWTSIYDISLPEKIKIKKYFNELYQYHPDYCREYNKGNYKKFKYYLTNFNIK